MADTSTSGLKTILLEARALAGEARDAYLGDVCADRLGLRDEVESLLAYEDAVPSVLDAGLNEAGGLLQRLKDSSSTTPTIDLDPAIALAAADGAGELIGPYRLVEILGEGGMGVVYRAEQVQPIRREVALKLIRRGLDTERIVARFDSERQALARMDHPSIARVLDAGASADGRPYFVMELVQGAPITDFCDTERLTLRDRIALAIGVCHAVQHAHQKGIIHRDLKPSNILVARQDNVPVPKVIDFGIAKAIEEPLSDFTLLTRAGQFMGTPDYMSPEQAGVLDMDVDTRTDVYALGVLLYELLCGRRPHQFERRTQEEVQQVLKHQEPERPSTGFTGWRLSSRWNALQADRSRRRAGVTGGRRTPPTPIDAEALAKIVETRRTTADKLRRQLSGDLDNIVLKAMQKEPDRRYGSVDQLADDLQRHLDGKPVLARPDTWTYRTGKFVRRHAVGVGVAAAAVLLLVSFAVMTTIQGARVARERDRAVAAEQRARTEAETARQVSDFMIGLFRVSDPSEARGNSITAREILDRGAVKITTELGDRPAVQGKLLQQMGSVYKSLGLYDEASKLLRQAVAVREKAGLPELGDSLDELGDIERYADRVAVAEPILRRALALRQKQYGPAHPKVAQTTNNLALVLHEQGKYDQAEAMHREALRIRRAALGPRDASVANSLNNLGITLRARNHYAEAEQVLREALSIRRDALGAEHPYMANTLTTLGGVLGDMGRESDAEPLLREALRIRRKVLDAKHPQLAVTIGDLASVLQDQNKLDEAETLYLETLTINRSIAGNKDSVDTSVTLNNLATLYEQRGDYKQAESMYEESLRMRRTLRGERHPSVAVAMNNLGKLRLTMGQLGSAERLMRDALALRIEKLGEANASTVLSHVNLGKILHARGAAAAAEEELRTALAFQTTEPRPPVDHPVIVTAQIELGRLLVDRQRPAEAEPMLRAALAARTKRFGGSDWRVAEVQLALGRTLVALRHPDQAARLLTTSVATLDAAGPAQQPLKREAVQLLAQIPTASTTVAAAPSRGNASPVLIPPVQTSQVLAQTVRVPQNP